MNNPNASRRLLGPGIVVCSLISFLGLGARQGSGDAVPIDDNDIAGVVTSPRGPEAGVWVIAETSETQTPFARIVVTDDRGR